MVVFNSNYLNDTMFYKFHIIYTLYLAVLRKKFFAKKRPLCAKKSSEICLSEAVYHPKIISLNIRYVVKYVIIEDLKWWGAVSSLHSTDLS